MTTENIWDKLDLSEENLKTAYDYLITQRENFIKATRSVLTMEVEISVQALKESTVTHYNLNIVAPQLGNFKKELLYVAELENKGRFPVNIFSELDEKLEIMNVEEKDLLHKIKEALSRPIINRAIENLYRQSIEAKKTKEK